jgi:hypothetical protein
MKRCLRLSPILSLAPLIRDDKLVAFNVGPDGMVYLVVALKPLDYRWSGWASFAKTVPSQPQFYRVIGLDGPQVVLNVAIEGERFNIHDVQPLPNGLLLVCAHSYYRGWDDFDHNGRVYTQGGQFVREMLLGDGIESVQATSTGAIWTSYCDEGVFGNYGWKQPVGQSGLVAWNTAGEKLYEFRPGGTLGAICDCYALNVETENDVWLYYYTEFPLVHLRNRQIESSWEIPLAGSHAFAVSGEHVLFQGGYHDRDSFRVFRLGDRGKVTTLAEIELCDEDGEPLVAGFTVGRADAIHFISGDLLYRVDVRTVVAT